MEEWKLTQLVDFTERAISPWLGMLRKNVATMQQARQELEDVLKRLGTELQALDMFGLPHTPQVLKRSALGNPIDPEPSKRVRLMHVPPPPTDGESPDLPSGDDEAGGPPAAAVGAKAPPRSRKSKPAVPIVNPQLASFLWRFRKYLEEHHISGHTKSRLSALTIQNRINHVRVHFGLLGIV